MYDLDTNPPKTKQDIRDYLTSWLQMVEESPQPQLVVEGEPFVQELGFRRAFHIHAVFRSLFTNEYVWWVFEEQNLEMFPKKRYATYEELLDGVIHEYYIAWKLNE